MHGKKMWYIHHWSPLFNPLGIHNFCHALVCTKGEDLISHSLTSVWPYDLHQQIILIIGFKTSHIFLPAPLQLHHYKNNISWSHSLLVQRRENVGSRTAIAYPANLESFGSGPAEKDKTQWAWTYAKINSCLIHKDFVVVFKWLILAKLIGTAS